MRRSVLALFIASAIVLGGGGGVLVARAGDAREAEERLGEVAAAERQIVRLRERMRALLDSASSLEDEIGATNRKNDAAARHVRDQRERIRTLQAELAALS